MLSYLPLVLRITAILSAATACTLYFLSKGKVEEKDKEIEQVRAELQILSDKNESADLEIASLQERLTEQSKLVEDAKIQLEEAKAETVAEMQESKRLQKRLIEAMKKTSSSLMPKALLDNYTKEEILELMSYLEAKQK